MLTELAVATGMVLLTVIVHGAGLYILSHRLRIRSAEEAETHIDPMSPRGIAVTLALVLGLFWLHGVEIWLYALLYWATDALPDLHTSVYFSAVTYATIGDDNAGLPDAWRLVAAIEGVNGIILLGWTTAFFVPIIARMRRS
ncbi:ion channel [Sphingosinicella sp. LHD-64]|uniref:ion channel n=1 Tax=Sphingosinicella sp. LHD-64 TaxID=3072139 RepID=UPI00280ECDC4|nr:ion channel [Sphingosinicella sp. LHD-64]MDQ8756003.1 ion channel [Sphingosinicella sp. LHD-64]